jgi:hypothetical protein
MAGMVLDLAEDRFDGAPAQAVAPAPAAQLVVGARAGG